MSNSNWTKQAAAAASRPDNNGSYAATVSLSPATEAELEAMRYRGTPLQPVRVADRDQPRLRQLRHAQRPQ